MNEDLKKQIEQLLVEKRYDELKELYTKIISDVLDDPSIKDIDQDTFNLDILNSYLESTNEILKNEKEGLQEIIEVGQEFAKVDQIIDDNEKIQQAKESLDTA